MASSNEALAAVVCSSPEFLHLFRRLRAQWPHLRIAILAVTRELGTPLSGRLLDIAQASEPLDRESGMRVDERLIATWTAAVAALRADAEVALPSVNGAGRD